MASNNKPLISTSSKRLLTMAASVAGTAMLVRSVVNEILPYELRDYVFSGLNELQTRLSSQLTITIQEKEGYVLNQIFEASKAYLATKISSNSSARRLRVSKQDDQKSIAVSIEQGEEIVDVFQGVQFKWKSMCQQKQSAGNGYAPEATEDWWFELSFHKKHRDTALESYLPYVLERGKDIKEKDKSLKLYMNERDSWNPVNLHHPATFDTIAMDPELKTTVMEDLARFLKRKDYYKKIGKAWKRGYLLYGPPGTGKSSLIAAIANYLKFDIYDLELAEVQWNAALQCLLTGMSNRSILVIEDIDCSIAMENREDDSNPRASPNDKVTLSGLLNFVDGLWSSCGEERIIIFTTNYKERLDRALLRPGRMDMHVYMGYCSPQAFRVLASNYHGVEEHPMFGEIERLVREVEVTPAEVAEELMRSDDADVAFQGLVDFIREKGERREDAAESKSNSDQEQEREREDSSDAAAQAPAAETICESPRLTRQPMTRTRYYRGRRGGIGR